MTTENIPLIMEEIGEVVRLIPQERDQQCTVEQIVYVTADPGEGCDGHPLMSQP